MNFLFQFDKIVVFGDCHKEIVDYVINYRTYIGPLKAIWGNLSGEDVWQVSITWYLIYVVSLAGRTCISELIFTLRLETDTVRFKRHRVIHLAIKS